MRNKINIAKCLTNVLPHSMTIHRIQNIQRPFQLAFESESKQILPSYSHSRYAVAYTSMDSMQVYNNTLTNKITQFSGVS